MLLIKHINEDTIRSLLQRFKLELVILNDNEKIPGSYWGEPEAGLIKNTVYVRPDTPVHSLLHETCHVICMDEARRKTLHTDAGGRTPAEENATCYLQILLADEIPEMGREKMFDDMDTWGYSFRLGSAKQWFKYDAEDAKAWLINHGLIDKNEIVQFVLRA